MKKHIILLLKTLINNNACVESARTKEKKYNIIAVALALVALFLSVLPIGVTKFNTKGSAWMKSNNYNYGLDLGLQGFMDDLETNKAKYTFEIGKTDSGEKCLNVDQSKWDAESTHIIADSPVQYLYKEPTGDQLVRIRVFVLTDLNKTDFVNRVKEIVGKYTDSMIFFGKTTVYAYLYRPGVSALNGFVGDYHHVTVKNFLEYRVNNEPAQTFNNWMKFFDESYIDVRWNNAWMQIGIMLGVNGGVILLMGFMVWILTRGKNNPYRIYSFWDGQKISYYACFTPSLLSLIGFAIPVMSQMLFALALGIRVMWLSMRTLRYNAPMKK